MLSVYALRIFHIASCPSHILKACFGIKRLRRSISIGGVGIESFYPFAVQNGKQSPQSG